MRYIGRVKEHFKGNEGSSYILVTFFIVIIILTLSVFLSALQLQTAAYRIRQSFDENSMKAISELENDYYANITETTAIEIKAGTAVNDVYINNMLTAFIENMAADLKPTTTYDSGYILTKYDVLEKDKVIYKIENFLVKNLGNTVTITADITIPLRVNDKLLSDYKKTLEYSKTLQYKEN